VGEENRRDLKPARWQALTGKATEWSLLIPQGEVWYPRASGKDMELPPNRVPYLSPEELPGAHLTPIPERSGKSF
jgi:hypothetical protein